MPLWEIERSYQYCTCVVLLIKLMHYNFKCYVLNRIRDAKQKLEAWMLTQVFWSASYATQFLELPVENYSPRSNRKTMTTGKFRYYFAIKLSQRAGSQLKIIWICYWEWSMIINSDIFFNIIFTEADLHCVDNFNGLFCQLMN